MSSFHVVTLGWPPSLIEALWRRIEGRSGHRFSHIAHPRSTRADWKPGQSLAGMHFFGLEKAEPLPAADDRLLDSLEGPGVPTLRNMILGDRVLCRMEYGEALRYATFLARRTAELYGRLAPGAVIGGFDALHNGIALAVARRMGVPWYALHFSVIPQGFAAFCDALSPAARVTLPETPPRAALRSLAEETLTTFERGRLEAPAYIEPRPPSLGARARSIPRHLVAAWRSVQDPGARRHLRFTDEQAAGDFGAALRKHRRAAAARRALQAIPALDGPPDGPYVLFGLHRQPESSIDVWAPFFSNQKWVIEVLSRSLPPAVRLLVKIHKSDVSNYSREQLEAFRACPGVELVRPFVNGRELVNRAAAVVSIQGTMGLEAALLGKPVILFGDSPVALFPSVSRVGEIAALPELVRRKLTETAPARESILEAYASYLAPFRPAAHNDWRVVKTDGEIARFADLFRLLELHLSAAAARGGSKEASA